MSERKKFVVGVSGASGAPYARRLLEVLAGQVAREVRGTRLARDLQESRDRIVRAREAERLRIRRDLHDGIGPTLAAARLQIDVLREIGNIGAGNAATALATMLDEKVDISVPKVRITDFDTANDLFHVDNAVFTGLANGALAASAFAANLSGLATDALDRIIYETDTGDLFFDVDGTGAAGRVRFAQITAGLPLTAADFLVI